MAAKDEIAFLFIGGAHQVFHLAPVAAELSRKLPDATVSCLYSDEPTEAALREVKETLDAPAMRLEHVSPPAWAEALARAVRHRSLRKGPLLLRLASRLKGAKAIVTPERTSAALRKLGLKKALIIHFRHGAGDRALKSEKKLKDFDWIVSPGQKGNDRAAGFTGISPDRVRSSGYVKLDYVARRGRSGPGLFPNDKPVVVYNPHFDRSISSWPIARQVIEAFRAQDRYNLVLAPHMRLADDMAPEELREWEDLAQDGGIIVDFRSNRLIDMTYTAAADIYLGDRSSQVYEFLSTARPVVFLNAHQASWQGDPHFAAWELGEVVEQAGDVIAAIDRARANHPACKDRQIAAIERAYGSFQGASARAADIIIEALAQGR